MARSRTQFAAGLIGCLVMASSALAQLEDHLWVGGTGNQLWQLDSNWGATTNHPAHFPNDPGRMDAVPATIVNSEGANLSVNLAANLNVNVGATDVTVASLTFGSTSNSVATTIASTGGKLVFENFEQNNTVPNPDVCAFNCGRALITSQGVAGVTNTISAPVGVNDVVEVTGTRNITFSGGLVELNNATGTRAVSFNVLPATMTAFITGNITTLSIDTAPGSSGVQDTALVFGGGPSGNEGIPTPPSSLGTIDISGVISGAGDVQFGTQEGGTATIQPGRIILRGTNTYSGETTLSRGNLVLDNDSAFGTSDLKQFGPSSVGMTGYNIESTADNRTIANVIEMGQWQTIKGQNSITFSGRVVQSNTAGWINIMPQTETLTLSGPQYVFSMADADDTIDRIYTFDGSGLTKVTGGIHSRWDPETEMEVINAAYPASIAKQGSGALYIDGNNDATDGTLDSNFNRTAVVWQGNLHFGSNGDIGSADFTSRAGAVGVKTGGVVGNATFLGKLNNANNPSPDVAGNAVFFDHGGLMLASGEYDDNLNFNVGPLSNAASMSIAAHESGSACLNCNTYTGDVTPSTTGTPKAPANTYRFGGGSGTLTLPGRTATHLPNQLTGGNNLLVANGGVVKITNTNNYTGATNIVGEYVSSLERAAAENTNSFEDDDNIPNDQIFLGTTLAVNSLANGGAVSSIGSSTNAASNLLIHGSTLRYEGNATSTDRLFTIGTGGATIDASGTGAVNFTNTGSLGVDIAEARTGNINTFFPQPQSGQNAMTIRNLTRTDDLQVGMIVSGMTIPANTTITDVVDEATILISNQYDFNAFFDNTPITFGAAAERKLTLSGANTGNNTLASVIPNASDGGLVGLTKTGGGKWIVTGNNTYTGDTSVEDGILSITNPFLANAADVYMTTGSIFDLSFVGADAIDELFFNGTAQAAGTWGAIGNASADFQSAFFTGTGLLQVSTGGAAPTGDYNEDGFVNAADYVAWRKIPANFGGDPQGYNDWRTNFGSTVGGGGGSGVVPEPTSAAMILVATVGFFLRARRGR